MGKNRKRFEFKDWKKAGAKYAKTNFPDWNDQMVAEFAVDLAWRYEGQAVSPESLEDAYEDWISGQSPYSPHCVPLDGYDYSEWGERQLRDEKLALTEFAITRGFESFEAERFASDTLKIISGIYDEETRSRLMEDWLNGRNEFSPHHIPFDEVNKAQRDERRALLRMKYHHVSDFSFKLFFHHRLTDSINIEEHFMRKETSRPARGERAVKAN